MNRHMMNTDHPPSNQKMNHVTDDHQMMMTGFSFLDSNEGDEQKEGPNSKSRAIEDSQLWLHYGTKPKEDERLMTSDRNNYFFWTPTLPSSATQNCLSRDTWLAGSKKLVARSFASMEMNSRDVEEWESRYHLDATKYCLQQTAVGAGQFAKLVGDVVEGVKDPEKFVETRPITSKAGVDEVYLTNTHAIATNTPRPRVHGLEGHAVGSLRDIIEMHLAQFSMEEMDNLYSTISSGGDTLSSTLEGTRIAKDVESKFGKFVLILHVSLWSDDFMPAVLKQRASLWIKTIELFLKGRRKSVTYMLALGKKGKDHEVVEERVSEELKELGTPTPMFHVPSGKMVNVVVRVITNMMDRPERCALNFIASHTGLYTKRWLWSARLTDSTAQLLPSCSVCRTARLLRLVSYDPRNPICVPCVNPCRECADWNYETPNHVLHVLKPDKFPSKDDENGPPAPAGRSASDGNATLGPLKQSYAFLKMGSLYAIHNLRAGEWTVTGCRVYMKSLGVSTAWMEYAVRFAGDSSKDIATIKWPTVWSGDMYSLEQCIDAFMHLFFHGITMSVFKLIRELLISKNKNAPFGVSLNPLLKRLQGLQLEFAKFRTFTNAKETRTGSYWSENWLAFAKTVDLLYIDCASLLSGVEWASLSTMLNSLSVLTANLMHGGDSGLDTEEEDVDYLDDCVKMFLSCFDEFERNCFGKSSTAQLSWRTKGNFLSLLNAKRTIAMFGSVRRSWDGNKEKQIQVIKPEVTKVRLTETYMTTKLDTHYKKHSLGIVSNMISNIGDDTDDENGCGSNRYSNLKIYSSAAELGEAREHGWPLSVAVVRLDGNERCAIYCYH